MSDTLERLRQVLVKIRWACSHDSHPDQFTANIAEFSGEAESVLAALRASERDERLETSVLQAVLDAISGKLDTSTEIADHPNVKFAQMERLKLLERASEWPREPVPVKPTKQWHNSRYSGEGVGSAGQFRVVIRTDRKTGDRYIELLHDDEAGGYGFTRRQARDLIPLLQTAVGKLAEGRQGTAAAPGLANQLDGEKHTDTCRCGHTRSEHHAETACYRCNCRAFVLTPVSQGTAAAQEEP